MNTGYRCFVVQGDEVTSISQRTFSNFYFRGKAELTQYSNEVIVLAVIFYETERRRPTRILHTDSVKLRVRSDGSLDESDLEKIIRKLALAVTSSDSATYLPKPEISPVAMAKMALELKRFGGRFST